MLTVALAAGLLFAAGYRFYGGWLARSFGLSAAAPTPATRLQDGVDYVPTPRPILLGQHFAAIAAVGPIAGPILAGQTYGWLPGVLWIAVGAVFIGAVHDFACLVASVRHDARSIGDVVRLYLGRPASLAFSVFIWLSLVYVVVVFADLTAGAFVDRPELGAQNFGPGVATTSFLYLGLAVLMGLALERGKWPLPLATAVFVPALFAAMWLGQFLPVAFSGSAAVQTRCWDAVILLYCFAASLIPMGVLLQPRGYLGGIVLYATFAVGVVGLVFGKFAPGYPAWSVPEGVSLFPLLFTTIACGACSGFHGLVASGTTSKQLARETDARAVGYGGMLLEGFVAVVAMSTLMLQVPGSVELGLGPDEIYARGLARFMEVFGMPFSAGVIFGKLAFATFIYDTLDVATRLGRYIVQELFGLQGRRGALIASALTLSVPAVIVFITFTDAAGKAVPLWRIFWPAFGASNQLLAALSLAGITVWLKTTGRNWLVTGLPAAFMAVVTVASLCVLIGKAWSAGRWLDPVGTTALVLLGLAAFVLARAVLAFRKPAESGTMAVL